MNQNTRTTPVPKAETSFQDSDLASAGNHASNVSGYAYNELADFPVQMIDPVAEVQKNLAHLEDLQARLRFMMREVRYLLKV